jgi:hypothetical protein
MWVKVGLGCCLCARSPLLPQTPLFPFASPRPFVDIEGGCCHIASNYVTMSSANRTRIIDPERAAESNSTLFLSVVCVAWSLALVTALVRFYTRAVLVRSFGKDDVFMAFSVVRCSLSLPTG